MKTVKNFSVLTMAVILGCSFPSSAMAENIDKADKVSVTGRWRRVSDNYTNTLYIAERNLYLLPDKTASLDEREDTFSYETEGAAVLVEGLTEIACEQAESAEGLVSELTEKDRETYNVKDESVTQKLVLTLTGPNPANPLEEASFEAVYVNWGNDMEYYYRLFADKNFRTGENRLSCLNNPEMGNAMDIVMNNGEKKGELILHSYGNLDVPVVSFVWEGGTGKEYLFTDADGTAITLTDRTDEASVLVLTKEEEP